MSILIAYFLIGAIMSIGLIIDRWDELDFNPDSVTQYAAMILVGVYAISIWPALLTEENMQEEKQ